MLWGCLLGLIWSLIPSVSSANSFNAALGKTASESSVRTTDVQLTADKAVDGSTNAEFRNCASTDQDDRNPWWSVDLGRDYTVTSVVITNRNAHEGRLHDITVTITREDNTDTVCSHYPGSAPSVVTITCDQVTWGRYVNITKRMDNYDDVLTLCEVQVMVFNRTYMLFERKTGKPITSHVTMAMDFPKCAHTCMESLTCLGINYNTGLGQCQLSNSTDSEDTTVGGWDFYVVMP